MSWSAIGTDAQANFSGSSVTLTYPGTMADGDLLHIDVVNDVSITPSTPSGYTIVVSFSNVSDGSQRTVFAKRASSEGSIVNVSATGASFIIADVAVFRGLSGSSLVDVHGSGNTGSSASMTASSVTTTATSDLLVFAGGNGSGASGTPPSGMVELLDDSGGTGLYIAYATTGSPGATGSKTATLSSSVAWSVVMAAYFAAVAASGWGPLIGMRHSRLVAN